MNRNQRVQTGRKHLIALVAIATLGSWQPSSVRAQFAQPFSSDASVSQVEQSGRFLSRVFRDSNGEHKYVLFVPSNYTPDRKWPAILYLHGAGERGNDGVVQTTVGLGPYVRARAATFPFLVVFPQCEETRGRILTSWSPDSPDGKRALAIFDTVGKEYSVDPAHRVLTGWSMGGYGTWSLGAAEPNRWSALVPIAGGGNPASAPKLSRVPIWAFHGSDDYVVRVDESRRMIAAVKAAGGHPLYTEIPGAGHDVWRTVYNDDRLYDWMLAPSMAPAGESQNGGPAEVRLVPQADVETPFVPAVAVPNAIAVRLGNDALKAIAHSAPRLIPADALTGGINDIFTSTESSGYSFSVQFSRISYSMQLARVSIRAHQPGLLNFQLGVQNVSLTIGSTYLQGSGKSAVAGPISIVIGHRYPVWLSFDVAPYIENNRLRLQLVGSRFEIPNDDWYVSPPYGVSTRGLGMTEERVTSGLVQGIYGQKYRIEQEAVAVIPSLLARLEQRLDLPEVTQAANAFWPLPVYHPRLKAWPQSVRVDDNGVSLVMGVTAAAVDPRKAPATPRVERPAGISLDSIPRDTELQLGIAPGMLEPLSRMLVQEGVARVNVLDIPVKTFAAFADRKALTEALPELASLPPQTEISAELVLAGPISVRDAHTESSQAPATAGRLAEANGNGRRVNVTAMKPDAPLTGSFKPQNGRLPNGNPARSGRRTGEAQARVAAPSEEVKSLRPLEFVVPKAVIALAVRENPQSSNWKPYAELEFDLTQQASATMVRRGFSERVLRIDWTGEPTVKASAHFVAGVNPKNSEIRQDQLRDLFVTAWKGWTQNGPASQVPVPDIDFQYSKLRLDGLDWAAPLLSFRFGNPDLKLTNGTNIDLVYETRSIYSSWSEPITLKPHKSHEFKTADPLLFRRKAGNDFTQLYTLPAGTHCEFRAFTPGGEPDLYRVREPEAVAGAR